MVAGASHSGRLRVKISIGIEIVSAGSGKTLSSRLRDSIS
jgi:hypothetical protein